LSATASDKVSKPPRERTRAIIADAVAELESKLAIKERNKTGKNQHTKGGLEDAVASKPPRERTRAATAKRAKVSAKS
jgi:hypothetical protein